jgi:transposase
MSLQLRDGHRVYVFTELVDFRAGFDKLSMHVREKMKKELVEGDLFLFLGKNRKRLKALCFDGTGLLLISKRLEQGRFMSVAEFEESELTVEELNLVLQGGLVRRRHFGAKAFQNVASRDMKISHETGSSGNEHREPTAVHPAR